MVFKELKKEYIPQALELAVKEYEEERRCNEQVPEVNAAKALEEQLDALVTYGYGQIALENDKIIGFLAFWTPIENFHGSVIGAFSPLGGNAYDGCNRKDTAERLFSAVSKELARRKVLQFAVCRYAYDTEIAECYSYLAFGTRCSDAVMELSGKKIPSSTDSKVIVSELIGEEQLLIETLDQKLNLHMNAAPVFIPKTTDSLVDWLREESIRIVAARIDGKVIGYMAIREDGENYIAETKSMCNICGAYVEKEYRSSGVAQQLLQFVRNLAVKEGRTHVGVDFETMNPTARRFWGKYFSSYTYSYERRIDERL